MKLQFTNIVITGSSVISACGTGVDAVLELVRSGGDACTAVPFDVLGADGHRWCKADGFKVSVFMPPMKARKMDRCSQFSVAAAGLALKDAGIDLKTLAPERIGIALGSGFCGVANSAEFLTGYFRDGVEGLTPMIFPNTVANAPASNASIEHGITGPNTTLVQRYCSAESAVMLACRFIEEGRADIMLAGGIDELTPLMLKGFSALGKLKEDYTPYGEGGGILVLESTEHAARRGATVRATLDMITTIGMLAPGREAEGLELLTDDAAGCSLVSLSGTAADLPALIQRVAGRQLIDSGVAIGRSLAMGGTALAVLLASLEPGQHGLHLGASPDGPYYAIRLRGGPPVQP
ncbi:MAG: beta-ketoacyl synthase [Geobacteraceae bacterium]|nr:beta-ketoacyl synthase [Geobacteraceae bacterium]